MRGEDALRRDHPVDVVGRRLPADEDHVLAARPRSAAVSASKTIFPDAAPGEAFRPCAIDLDARARVDHRVQELVELAGSMRATASSRVIRPSSTMSTADFSAAAAVRFAVRVWRR